MSAVSSEVSADHRAVPDECTALLTVKIGDVSRTSRKHLTIVTFPFLLSEGLDVFRAKVDSCTDKALEHFRGERHVREDLALYMRPGAHSKQAELVEITHSNFESRVARSYKNYLKRKTDEPFQCEVYVYVKKVAPPRRRRIKEADITAAAAGQVALHGDFTHGQRLDAGELAGTGVPDARDIPVGVKRKRSMGSDEGEEQHHAHRAVQAQQVHDGYYRTVRMVVNGAVVPVQVNVQDILACFAVFQQQPTGDEVLRSHEGSVNGAAGTGADDLHG
ncbi:Bidirectional sugar transporter SWEET11 [Phytophthora cinnamomi]|uniref:Bidirectional sugar transporter SWEET11 n=1 Tax=Phytophthora cinnamomi TaxID=4785 RepID=UPI00355A646E|nr:Bidirectional sugar transporter SWEET11 [Phytophthora cinnamomi]